MPGGSSGMPGNGSMPNRPMPDNAGGTNGGINRPMSGNNPAARRFANENYYDDPVEPELDFIEEEEHPSYNPRKPGGGVSRRQSEPTEETDSQSEHIEPQKRIIALIIDSLACYMAGMLLSIVPFLMHFITLTTTWFLFLLIRDWLFEGRGVGKNLMGLQVIDVKTGNPCSLKQSVLRNIIILAPFAALQVISVILAFTASFMSNAVVIETVKGLFNVVGMVYMAVVLPVECYRAYTRDDSRRLGDVWAGTAIIESHMDFSNPFSK